MKTQLLSLLIAAACFAPGGAARAFVYETSAEFQADGDFDADGRPDLVIADKATGVYRLGYQLSETNYTWVAARASGVKPLTGFNLGKLITLTSDALVFTGVEAIRLFADSTVQYYGRVPAGAAQSAIQSASYTFTTSSTPSTPTTTACLTSWKPPWASTPTAAATPTATVTPTWKNCSTAPIPSPPTAFPPTGRTSTTKPSSISP